MEGALDQYVVQGLGNNITFLRDVYRNPRYCYFFLYYLLIFYSRVYILLRLLSLCCDASHLPCICPTPTTIC